MFGIFRCKCKTRIDKDDYLNLRLKKAEREAIISFANQFIKKFNSNKIFKDDNKYSSKELNLLESEFINIFIHNKELNENYYTTRNNKKYKEDANYIYQILKNRLNIEENNTHPIVSGYNTVSINDISKLFIETLIYLEIIEQI